MRPNIFVQGHQKCRQKCRNFGAEMHRLFRDVEVIGTTLPFNVFKTQHFIPGDECLVATEVDAKNRIVKEINGLPAAIEYARITGVNDCCLSPDCFAASPVVVLIDGTNYVRSIQKVNPDDSLTFFCAIDEGLVFRVAQGHDLPGNLIRTLEDVEKIIGTPQRILACDCILRKLEMSRNKQMKQVKEIMLRYPIIGFNTYGEQFRRLHVNQTLTGLANRRRFMAALETEWYRALRSENTTGLAMIDIDHFKRYNDSFGHPAGDLYLQKVADALNKAVRRTDITARHGGEDFAVILTDVGHDIMHRVAERARKTVSELQILHLENNDWITISIGVSAITPSNDHTIESFIELADTALYAGKHEGRNRVHG